MTRSPSVALRADRAREPRGRTRAVARAVLVLTLFGQSLGGPTAFGTSLAQTSQPTPPSTSAQAARSRNATFGIQPAGATKPDSRSYFSIGATPGARLTDHFAVRNYSLRPLTLTVQTADALNTPEGDFAVLPPNQPNKEVGTWITLITKSKTIVVPARGIVIIPFNVVIPRNAQPGDHAGGITVTLESLARSDTGQTYKLLQSVGARVFVRVSGPLDPRLAIEDLRVRYKDTLNPIGGSALVSYTVHNVGNVALGGRQNVRISGLLGLGKSARGLEQLGVLLPGYSVKQSVTVKGFIPQIWMTAKVSIEPLILPGSVQDIKGPFEASANFWAIPWILLIVALLLIGVWWYRRRRRNRPRPSRERKKVPAVTPEPEHDRWLEEQLHAE